MNLTITEQFLLLANNKKGKLSNYHTYTITSTLIMDLIIQKFIKIEDELVYIDKDFEDSYKYLEGMYKYIKNNNGIKLQKLIDYMTNIGYRKEFKVVFKLLKNKMIEDKVLIKVSNNKELYTTNPETLSLIKENINNIFIKENLSTEEFFLISIIYKRNLLKIPLEQNNELLLKIKTFTKEHSYLFSNHYINFFAIIVTLPLYLPLLLQGDSFFTKYYVFGLVFVYAIICFVYSYIFYKNAWKKKVIYNEKL